MQNSWSDYRSAVATKTGAPAQLVIAEPELRRFAEALLISLGVPAEDAALVSDVFIQSDLRGEDSHGMRLLLQVLHRIRAGGDVADAKPTIVSDQGATALLDANRGLGQVMAAHAMRLCIGKARAFGIGIVGVRNANSFTSAKYFPMMAVAEDMIGIAYANSGVQLVAPHGGRRPLVGTNPISIAAPAATMPPFVLDMAISPAMERVFQAFERREPIPAGWAIDTEGEDTTDPGAVLASRTLLPWGGYKGFGLGLAHEILTGVMLGGHLFGAGATGFIPHEGPMNVSQTFIVIDPARFTPIDTFKQTMDEALRAVHATGVRPGFDHVYYPGEKGSAEEVRRRHDGIPIQARVVAELNEIAATCGVPGLHV